MYNITAYVHFPTMNRYDSISSKMIDHWKTYKFFNCIKRTNICVPKDCMLPKESCGLPNEIVVHTSHLLHDYELGVMSVMYNDAMASVDAEHELYMYQHLKGLSALSASKNDIKKVEREDYHRKLSKIDVVVFSDKNVQAVGINLAGNDVTRYVHFSGNFWIARASWIRSLYAPTLENARQHFPWVVPPNRYSKGIGQIRQHAHRYFWEAWIGQSINRDEQLVFVDSDSGVRISP